MILKRRVSLGGVQLDELDDRIIITGIDESAGKESITGVASAYGPGQRITNMRRETLDVTVKFAMRIKNDDMAGRAELLEAVNAWAAPGGWLKVGYRPNRRLNVILAQAPGGGDMFTWNSEFSLTFRAYSVPYWADTIDTTAESGSKANGSMSIDVPGSANTVANVTVANMSGSTINHVKLTVAGKVIEFNSLSMTGSESLVIDHVQNSKIFYFRSRCGTSDSMRSVMKRRTAESADDFTVSPGITSVAWEADRAVKVTVKVRGRYL